MGKTTLATSSALAARRSRLATGPEAPASSPLNSGRRRSARAAWQTSQSARAAWQTSPGARTVLPRRFGAVGTAHLIPGLMARGAGGAFAGFAKRMAARRTIAQLRALDDRTLVSIAAKSPRAGSTSGPISAGATIERDLLNAAVHPALRRQRCWPGAPARQGLRLDEIWIGAGEAKSLCVRVRVCCRICTGPEARAANGRGSRTRGIGLRSHSARQIGSPRGDPGPQISRAQVQEVESVEAGHPLAVASQEAMKVGQALT